MADFDDRVERVTSDGSTVRPEAAATKVNWVPTFVMLGLFFWWIALALIFYGRFPDQHDAALAIAYMLLAGVVFVAAPALTRQIAPEAAPAGHRAASVLICIVVGVPLPSGSSGVPTMS